MIRHTLSIIAICSYLAGHSQTKIKNYVLQQSVPIFSIEADLTQYDDLESIGNAIGNSSIVMLGEQDHGDAPTFSAKTRLIKYLHEKKGFNVIAFESDFFGLNHGWDQVSNNKAQMESFITNNIYPVWTMCHTCKNLLFEYIPSTYQTSTPLQVTGFDNQMVLNHSAQYLVNYVDSVIKKLDLAITKQQNYSSHVLPLISSIKNRAFTDTTNLSEYHQYLEIIKHQSAGKTQTNSFFEIIINNLTEEARMRQSDVQTRLESRNIRDHQMAENLKWLKIHKYPNEKIIVWAANAHIANYIYSDQRKLQKKFAAMGHYLKSDSILSEATYILGFTSYEGIAGRLGHPKYKVRNPQKNGFENWINPNFEYSFTDFKKYNEKNIVKQERFYLKALGHQTAFKNEWNNVFDGIFFIRKMYSCQQ